VAFVVVALYLGPVVAAREPRIRGPADRAGMVGDGVLGHAQDAGDLGVVQAIGEQLRDALLRVDVAPRHGERMFANRADGTTRSLLCSDARCGMV
jgi:hypothetical protein